MHRIRKERFEAFVGHSRHPRTIALSQEMEWWASDFETILATVLVDSDGEFFSIILGRDTASRFRCIASLGPFQSIPEARQSLFEESEEILASKQVTFPQGDETGKRIELFEPLHTEDRLCTSFKRVLSLPGYSSAKEIIAEVMHHYTDVDGNFTEQFQTNGFDSRLWELFLFSYFNEENLLIDRTHHAPDFLVSDGQCEVAVEAVTVQATQNSDTEKLDIDNLTPERIKELQRHYMPIKFGSPLYSKLKKGYWKMGHVEGLPLVIAIADFHAKQSMLWSSTALQDYLYGVCHDFHHTDSGNLIITPQKILFHEYRGKRIPSGFFFTDNAEYISAVIFSATGTISKFIRMGKLAGFGDQNIKVYYRGSCYKHDPNSATPDQFFFEVDESYNETWGQGITVFHNPRALFPLPRDIFPSIAHNYMRDDGQIVSYIPDFCPYNGLTVMVQFTDERSSDREHRDEC